MSKFKVGDRVVCVNATGASWLQHGGGYVISSVDGDMVHVDDGEVNLCEDRFELTPEPPKQLNTPITDAVAKIYEALLPVPEEHRHKVLSAVAELL